MSKKKLLDLVRDKIRFKDYSISTEKTLSRNISQAVKKANIQN